MARRSRLVVPGEPHHVELRGNAGGAICRDDEDRRTCLELLVELAPQTGNRIHAYCLLGDQLHLLLTPSKTTGLPKMMQALGRRYVQGFNRRHRRSGTLWEGRYRAAPLQAEGYLLDCMRYLDLLPVESGLVSRPEDYRWSSCGHYCGRTNTPFLSPPQLLWGLGNTPFEREARYREGLHEGLDANRRTAITNQLRRGWPLGDQDYLVRLADQVRRPVARRRPGRPAGRGKSGDPDTS